jgi:hypothetical protein
MEEIARAGRRTAGRIRAAGEGRAGFSAAARAPLVTLDRNERMRLVHQFRMLARRSWVSKETGKHRGVITRTAESVFGTRMCLTEK